MTITPTLQASLARLATLDDYLAAEVAPLEPGWFSATGLLAPDSLRLDEGLNRMEIGHPDVAPADVWAALFAFDETSTNHLIIRTLRVPRAAVAAVVGASLAVAGAIMQGLTRNPLASPGILGINHGAGLVAVTLMVVVGGVSAQLISLAAFAGATLVALLIYLLAWRGGDSPLRLILVGIGLGAVAGAMTTLMITFGDIYNVQRALIWLTGSVYGRSWDEFWSLLPWIVTLTPLVFFLARDLNALNLGEEIAQGLGSRVFIQRGILILIAVALAGSSVAANVERESMKKLRAEQLSLAYDSRLIIEDLGLSIEAGKITALVGPNGCGKSTLLRGLSRLLKPKHGTIYLSGRAIQEMTTKDLAKELGILPQSPQAPEGLTVYELVAQGRYPHQGFFKQWSAEDEEITQHALTQTNMSKYAHRPLDTLSGGQRQRAWIAMALAQETAILMLDEPTTFLDLAYQIEVLDLFRWGELPELDNCSIIYSICPPSASNSGYDPYHHTSAASEYVTTDTSLRRDLSCCNNAET